LGATPSTASFVGKLSDSGLYLQGLHFASASRWCKDAGVLRLHLSQESSVDSCESSHDGEKTVIRARGVKTHARAVREVLETAVLAVCGE